MSFTTEVSGPGIAFVGPRGDPGPPGPAMTSKVQMGTAYTLTLDDSNAFVDFTNAAPVAVTVPLLAWVTPTLVSICANGLAGLTIVAGPGVTIRNNASALTQWQEIGLRYLGGNNWVRVG